MATSEADFLNGPDCRGRADYICDVTPGTLTGFANPEIHDEKTKPIVKHFHIVIKGKTPDGRPIAKITKVPYMLFEGPPEDAVMFSDKVLKPIDASAVAADPDNPTLEDKARFYSFATSVDAQIVGALLTACYSWQFDAADSKKKLSNAVRDNTELYKRRAKAYMALEPNFKGVYDRTISAANIQDAVNSLADLWALELA